MEGGFLNWNRPDPLKPGSARYPRHMTLYRICEKRPKISKPISSNLKMQHDENLDLGFMAPPKGVRQGENQRRIPQREPILAKEKVGRNEPCTCGSGKKYKKCCGKISAI